MTQDEAKRLIGFTLAISRYTHDLERVMAERKVRDDFLTGYHKGMADAATMLCQEVTDMLDEEDKTQITTNK